MSRTVLSIKMLNILKKNKIISKSELAKRLNTNKRNIIELRKELEKSGYEIKIILGKDGGYQLIQNNIVNFDNENLDIFSFLHEYIKKTNIFPKKEECLTTLESYLSNNTCPSIEVTSDAYLHTKKINKNLSILYDSIISNKKVYINYLNSSGKEEVFYFLPYNFIIDNEKWYCSGFKEKDSSISATRLFLPNINKIIQSDQTFTRTIPNHKTLEIKQNKYSYHYLYLEIQNRWDLFNYKFGLNQKTKKINDHIFSVNAIITDNSSIDNYKTMLGKDLLFISIT